MANSIGDMVVKIVGDNSSFDASIDSSSKKLDSFGKASEKIGKGLSVALTLPIVAAGAAALKSAGQMQLYQASFETMLGSAEKATTMIADMQKMAAETPFELGDLAESGKMLLQYGISAEQIMPMIKTLGDISQGSSAKLQTLSLAFGQMSSTGKLMGQDLLQMINAGFNPLFEISQKTGESMASLKDKMSKGLITVDMVTESFKRATSQGGKFFGGMEKASQTLPGLLSTLKDDVATTGRAFVEDLMPQVMEAVKGLSNFAQWLGNLDGPTKTFIVTMLGLAAATGPVALGIGKISTALAFLAANPVVAAITAVGALAAGAIALAAALDKADVERVAREYNGLAQSVGVTNDELSKLIPTTNLLNQAAPTELVDTFKEMATNLELSYNDLNKIVQANKGLDKDVRSTIQAYIDKLAEETRGADARRNAVSKAYREEQAQIAKTAEEQKKADDEKKARDAEQIANRKKFAEEYKSAIENITVQEKAGLITSSEAYDETAKATKKYAEELISLGYWKEKEAGITNIGTKALSDALIVLDEYNNSLKENEKNKQKQIEADEEYLKLLSEIDAQTDKNNKQDRENAEWEAEQDKKNLENKKYAFEEVYSAAWEIAGAITEIYTIRAQKEIDAINEVRDAELEALRIVQEEETKAQKERQAAELSTLDAQLQEILYKKGYVSAQTIAQYEAELAAAIATGDATLIQKAQEALDEAKIREEYAKKEKDLKEKQAADDIALKKKQDAEKAEIEKEAEDRTRKLAYEANMATWRLNVASTIASGARAAIESYVNGGGWPWGAAAAAAMAGITAAQIAVLNENKPQLATGGIILPTNGGTDVTVGEGGKAEAVIPLDKLDSMLRYVAENRSITDSKTSVASGTGATSAPVNIFQIGNVIADPSGLRELNRLLNKYGTIETKRVG